MLRATTTICCGLFASLGLLLPQTASPPPAGGQSAPAREAPTPEWEHALDVDGAVALAVGTDTAYVIGRDRTLQAFDLSDGSTRWSVVDVEARRLVAGGDTVVVVGPGTLTARAAADGRERWRQPMPDGDVGLGWSDDRLAVTSGAHARLLDPDGQLDASLAFPAALRLTPVMHGTLVAGATDSGRLVVFDRTRPETPIWSSLPVPDPVRAMTLTSDRLFVTSDAGILSAYVVRAGHYEARPEWAFALYRPISGRPAVADGTVFASTYDNALHAIDRRSGTRRWNRPLGGRPVGDVSVAGDRVVVPLADGSVTVVNGQTGVGIARLARPDQAEQLLAIEAVPAPARAVVTVTSGTSGENILRLWRLDR